MIREISTTGIFHVHVVVPSHVKNVKLKYLEFVVVIAPNILGTLE